MMSTLDLTLLSLYRTKGQDLPVLPGLFTQNPPRRTARGRESDRLLIYLNLVGNLSFSNAEYAQITNRLAERFYQTSGSLTFALKSSVEALNTVLAERNMKTTGQGQYAIGVLVLAALRGNQLYLVQAGPTRAYWFGEHGTKQFYDPNLSGKGLGLSQNTRMYFAQAQLADTDRLLLCAAHPKEWESALLEPGIASIETLRRRLTTITNDGLNAVLISASEGEGEFSIISASSITKSEPAPPLPVPGSPPPGPEPAPDLGQSALPVGQTPLNSPATASEPLPPASISISTPAPMPRSVRPPLAGRPLPRRATTQKTKSFISPEQRTQMTHAGRRSARWLAQSIQALRNFSHATTEKIEQLAPRLLPGEEDEPQLRLGAPWLAFIAVAIPLVVVVIAITIYFEFGRPAQYETYYRYAAETAQQTQNLTNPAELRLKWQATLDHLDLAEEYSVTENSQRLRQEALTALDTLDRVLRVAYRPAFNTPFASNVFITRLAASDYDLYLLNGNNGGVLRGNLNGDNYSLENFDCKPGTYNGITVGQLIDIVALPRTSPDGITLMGLDKMGNILYCAPGEAPRAAFLKPPDTLWKGISAIAYDAGNLYVLDAESNAIWVYFGQAGAQFPDSPLFFFEQDIPRMAEAIGMAVNGDDLYILHEDGHLTTCTLSRIYTSPTRCIDPAILTDTRPGYQGGATLTDGIFSQIVFTPPPDPSVALLESNTRSIFRFSPRALELQNQIQSQGKTISEIEAITAMAFSPNKVLFVVIDSQVYFAVNIP